MKKRTKTAVGVGLALVIGASMGLIGCGKTITVTTDEYELSAYTGGNKDESGSTVYNTALFYSNSLQQGYPDPQVLDNTAQDGYYYLYGTSSNFSAMRSKNLAEWENVGPTFRAHTHGAKSDEIAKVTNSHNWAPEAVYDPDTKLYYLFFSAMPDMGHKPVEAAPGIVESTSKGYNMYVATAKSPTGPFTMVDFSDESMCGAGNTHNLNTEAGKEITKEDALSNKYAYVVGDDDKYYEAAFPHYWAKYCLFSPDELSKVMQKNGVSVYGGSNIKSPPATYVGTIDPSPFVDPVTQKKYLYFKSENDGWNINIAVEMKDWLTPIWSTAKYIAHSNFYSIEDWRAGTNRGVSYETTECNEGPFMLYHKAADGKDMYYFTYSVNDYGTSDYQVGMAVGNSPLGPFRKLTEAEGGLLLCSSTTDSDTVSGAGHHSFVTLGDQLFIVYHRHRDFMTGGPARYTAMDEVKFITVKDKDGNDMEIPYVNGPTDSVQPLPVGYSGYKNVAGSAAVDCSAQASDINKLTDGLLSVHKAADETFMSYIGETEITETSTFTFDFDTATSVRAVLIYNSASHRKIFRNIPRMEFTLKDGSVRVIRDVKFDLEQYCTIGGQNNDTVNYVRSGAAAFAEFYDVEVTSIKITVEVPQGQSAVGISEIRILGKA